MQITTTQANLCFLLSTYKEVELALWTLSNIRKHHLDSQIISLSDGVDYSSHLGFFLENRVLYKELPHLKTIASGGLWVERYLSFYLEHSSSPYLIKLDPDTGVHRSIAYIPEEADVFGSYANGYLDSNSCGFTREAVITIVNSGLLREAKYNEKNLYTYRDRYKRIRPSTDRALYEVIRDLNLTLVKWGEARSTSSYRTNPNKSYALTHPNPSMVL
jgi:hypothetical protein